MPDNRRVQLKVAYSPIWATQLGFGQRLTNNQLTAVLPIREGGQQHIMPMFIDEDLKDCTTQYLVDKIVLHRYARLTVDLEVDQTILLGLLKFAFSVDATPNYYMLGPKVFDLLATTFIVGFDDDEDTGVVLQDAALESLTITGAVEQKLQVTAVFVGKGDYPDAADFAFAECEPIVPLRFDQNFSLMLNNQEYNDKTRKLAINYNNNLPMRDYPFALGIPDITRPIARGNMRNHTIDWLVTGRINNALGRAGTTIPPTHYPLEITIGDPGIILIVPDVMLRPGSGNYQDWDGEVSLACINMQLTPTRVSGDIQSPMAATNNN